MKWTLWAVAFMFIYNNNTSSQVESTSACRSWLLGWFGQKVNKGLASTNLTLTGQYIVHSAIIHHLAHTQTRSYSWFLGQKKKSQPISQHRLALPITWQLLPSPDGSDHMFDLRNMKPAVHIFWKSSSKLSHTHTQWKATVYTNRHSWLVGRCHQWLTEERENATTPITRAQPILFLSSWLQTALAPLGFELVISGFFPVAHSNVFFWAAK